MADYCVIVCTFTGATVIGAVGLWVLGAFADAAINMLSRKNRPMRVLVEYVLNRNKYKQWLEATDPSRTAG